MAGRGGFELMARIGYTARGLVYAIVGGLAGAAALGASYRPVGSKGAFEAILHEPLGYVLIGLLTLGLLCFAGWRALQAVLDVDGHGAGRRGLMRRLAYLGGGLFYLGLALFALSIAFGWGGSGDEDKAARDWTAWLLGWPFGRWLVVGVGLGFAAAGLVFAKKAWSWELKGRLALPQAVSGLVAALGRFGNIARGGVFALVGLFLIGAALHSNAGEARGLAGALGSLQDQPYGWGLLGVTAVGLLAFGVFEVLQAAFRRIDAPESLPEAKRDAKAELERLGDGAGSG